MNGHELEINSVLAQMREIIGTQAQEIAVLKATLAALTPPGEKSAS